MMRIEKEKKKFENVLHRKLLTFSLSAHLPTGLVCLVISNE